MTYLKKNVIVVLFLIILTLHIEDRLLLSFQTVIAARFQLFNGVTILGLICPSCKRRGIWIWIYPSSVFLSRIDHKFGTQNGIAILIYLIKTEGSRLILHL